MLHWIQRGTRLCAGVVFFIILANILVTSRSLSFDTILRGVAIAFLAAVFFWFVGFVVFDIIIKGMITHIEDSTMESLIDGGMLQHIRMMQEEYTPGGEEIPFSTSEKKAEL